MEGFYELLEQDEKTITYAYSGWDFNDPLQKLDIAKRLDGRVILHKQIEASDAVLRQTMMIARVCANAQVNQEDMDLLAWFTARSIQNYAKHHKSYPNQGRWLI